MFFIAWRPVASSQNLICYPVTSLDNTDVAAKYSQTEQLYLRMCYIPIGMTKGHEVNCVPTSRPEAFSSPSYINISAPTTLDRRQLSLPAAGVISVQVLELDQINELALQLWQGQFEICSGLLVSAEAPSITSSGETDDKECRDTTKTTVLDYVDFPEEGFTDLVLSLSPDLVTLILQPGVMLLCSYTCIGSELCCHFENRTDRLHHTHTRVRSCERGSVQIHTT
ncbi:hypothetical protein BC832DRAFT_354458 [Gaertneriomyces semiglobifer]|nr:hypothetical protein BC832DRAFT_354458 [Gaertneriomyces semiglobifer]